ncbi:MAG: hypothetical protein AVDCRST_MAG87-1698 [uncultured Thermomicrobiales bacterium]|uniref:Response regulatory domain-containing protein n=1 Tax=uncultured Thermomicrobiales bacterium TaxID=1645740 RepID=A0A6J4UXK5_9BACT|nr:MAG: hypothetical protein AVDCRST_MAG87-1698 [uncultured Thermomicrobiales bacterium]
MHGMPETKHPEPVLPGLMMPDGDGWEVLQIMQAPSRLRAIPVVVMSVGFNRHRPDGVDVAFVSKPFDVECLLETVTNTIGPASELEPSGPSPLTP